MIENKKGENKSVQSEKKYKKGSTYHNYQIRKLNEELEIKLPNEFKGSIYKYNSRNSAEFGLVDDNDYSF